jgi:phage terminase large subunit GpA-like protein
VTRRVRATEGPALLSAAALLAEARRTWAPRESLTVSQWADRHRVLSSAATPTPGPWRTDREPWQRGLMDAIHEEADTIVVMKSAQVGVTESLMLNTIGYHIAQDPGPMLLVEPSEALARRVSKNRLAFMLAATPALVARVPPARSRSSANSLLHKSFAGGYLVLAGANSPTALASDPMRLVLFDEVDKYPPHLGEEGDPVSLGMKRTATFWNRRHVLVSTPTLRGSSKIEAWFLLSDQRRYVVPCPRCGHRDWFTWNDPKHFWISFTDRDPATARLVCPRCAGRIEDHERVGMIAAAERDFKAGGPDPWQPTAPLRGVIGFHVWEAYKSTATLARIVANFLRARELGLDEQREWWNGTLGEPWEEPGEAVETSALLTRRERYLAEVPAGVLYLTAGVDTQDDRLEVWVWGWGLGKEAWLVDVRTLPGDPREPEVWAMLDELRARQWRHARGHTPMIARMAIDSAGHRTDHVYAYVTKTQHQGVRATIGRDGPRPIWTPGHQPRPGPGRRRCPLFVVGVDNAKAEVNASLRLATAGPGFVHLPMHLPQSDTPLDESYLDQLTAEKWARKIDRRKRTRWVWELKRAGLRNEGLDCAVLALWALSDLRPDLPAAAAGLERSPAPVAPSPPAEAPASPFTAPTATVPPASGRHRGRRFVRSGYLNR